MLLQITLSLMPAKVNNDVSERSPKPQQDLFELLFCFRVLLIWLTSLVFSLKEGFVLKKFVLGLASNIFQRFVVGSRVLSRCLFGFWFLPLQDQADHYFDVTTLVLGRKALENMGPQSHVIDLGTGAVAVLGHFFWKKRKSDVVCCDVDPAIVALAKENIAHTNAQIQVVQSNFFDQITEPFDIVTFNAPYVNSGSGTERGLPEHRRSQWDGGEDGTDVAAEFLQSVAALGHPVVAYLGINRLHVSRELITPLIQRHSQLSLREVFRSKFLPVDVYVVDHLASGDPS